MKMGRLLLVSIFIITTSISSVLSSHRSARIMAEPLSFENNNEADVVLKAGYPGWKPTKFKRAPQPAQGRFLYYRKTPKVEKFRSAVHELYMRPYNYVSYEMGGGNSAIHHSYQYHTPSFTSGDHEGYVSEGLVDQPEVPSPVHLEHVPSHPEHLPEQIPEHAPTHELPPSHELNPVHAPEELPNLDEHPTPEYDRKPRFYSIYRPTPSPHHSYSPTPHHYSTPAPYSPTPAPYSPTRSPYHYSYSPTPLPYSPNPSPYSPTPAPYTPTPHPHYASTPSYSYNSVKPFSVFSPTSYTTPAPHTPPPTTTPAPHTPAPYTPAPAYKYSPTIFRENLPKRLFTDKKTHDSAGKPPEHEKEEEAKLDHHAVAVIQGDKVSGTVHFYQLNGPTSAVKIVGNLTGLTPGSHGFHVHQMGDTTNGCKSMGGHFNPNAVSHGAPYDVSRHVGDLGNIQANSYGVANFERTDRHISLNGINSVLGRGVVVHAGQDDLGRGGNDGSLKTGNAGGRVACGVIGISNPSV